MKTFGFTRPQQKKGPPKLSYFGVSLLFLFSLLVVGFFSLGIRVYSAYSMMNDSYSGDLINDHKSWVSFNAGVSGFSPSKVVYHGLELYSYYGGKIIDPSTVKKHLTGVIDGLDSLSCDTIDSFIGGTFQLCSLFKQVDGFEDDLISMAGFDGPQQYLVVLQNESESKPNGGFFGSFARMKVKDAKVVHLEIIDSYIINRENPQAVIKGPERLLEFLPHNDLHFVGANKIGFTYQDGAHIEQLYKKAYPNEQIRGVIFLKTGMFEKIVPGFEYLFRERQFVNAATDLIRGSTKFGKKDLYLTQVSDIFEKLQGPIILGFIKNIGVLINQRDINAYLNKISGPFHTWLRTHRLTTRYEADHFYLWENNVSNNKSDRFISKNVQVKGTNGTVFISVSNEDASIIDFSSLPDGEYTISIRYSLAVPTEYSDHLSQLEQKYGIQLTFREQYILGLNSYWKTRSQIYFPKNVIPLGLSGNIMPGSGKLFSSSFSPAGSFETEIEGNMQQSLVEIRIRIKNTDTPE